MSTFAPLQRRSQSASPTGFLAHSRPESSASTQTYLLPSSRFAYSYTHVPVLEPAEPSPGQEAVRAKTAPLPGRTNTTGLPDALKTGIETLSGLPMDDVRVHYHSSKPAQVQALAYTQGTDIHIGPGQEQHLSHEAWHVVQQKQGRVKPTLQAGGQAISDDQRLEQEADVKGDRANRDGHNILQRNDRSDSIFMGNNSRLVSTLPSSRRVSWLDSHAVIQRKVRQWNNPWLAKDRIATPTEGSQTVKKAANDISDALEDGADHVKTQVTAYGGGTKATDVENFFVGKGIRAKHAQNFVNKLIDWGQAVANKESNEGRKQGLLKATIGYIIEGFGDIVAGKIGAGLQAAIGGARPDYEITTSEKYLANGATYQANGFVDATSAEEAKKGHIADKVLRIGEKAGWHYPHLYDAYYDDIDLGGVKPRKRALDDDDDDEAFQERQKTHAARAKASQDRRESTRAGKKLKASE